MGSVEKKVEKELKNFKDNLKHQSPIDAFNLIDYLTLRYEWRSVAIKEICKIMIKKLKEEQEDDLIESKWMTVKIYETMLKHQKRELIGEFLRDWKWGVAYESLWPWINYEGGCKCKVSTIKYWKWFEKKWEAQKDV